MAFWAGMARKKHRELCTPGECLEDLRRRECRVCSAGVATEKFPLFKQKRFRPPIAVYTRKTCRQLPSPGARGF